MAKIRVDWLNWSPDLEDTEFNGLTVADNVIHEPEGYKPVYLASAGGFATTGSLATVTSIVTKAIGSQSDTISAWLSNDTLYVGINGVTSPTTATGYPPSFATGVGQEVTAFDVAEYAGKVVFTAQANGSTIPTGDSVSISVTGVMDYT